ncbi:hypothetical protein [Streptomyces sp. NPDC001435]|uniref:hypothetical protein n=1 Tax=unclassified Streptomyces TaxID=2593676 RepID=UPI0036D10CDC
MTVPSADGANHDGSPYKPVTFTASGPNLKYAGGSTRFDLSVDAERVIGAYRYFVTDPLPGWEHYADKTGGDLSNLRLPYT